MSKQKMTIIVIGLMCFSSVSGFFTVICHGSDGHIAVEPVVHQHCECPGPGGTGDQGKLDGCLAGLASGHDHCKDTVMTSHFTVSARKNVRLSKHKVFAVNSFFKSIPSCTASSIGYLVSKRGEFSSYFTALRTIILLA